MAVSLLIKSGRVAAFKTLQLKAWGHHRLPTTVFLSTKSEGSKKHSAKDKGEAISSTKPERAVKPADEDLRKFLARKTLVTFPQKTFERESVSSSTRVSGKKLADEESSSSSSSDSDSSSDSEEEDGALKDTVKAKVSSPRQDPISFENRTMKVKKRTEKHFPQEQDKARAPYSLSSAESSVSQKGLNQSSDNKLLRSDLTKRAPKQRPDETPVTSVNLDIKPSGSQRPTEVVSKQVEASLPEATSSKLSRTPSRPRQSIAQNPTLMEPGKNAAAEMQETDSQGRGATVQQDETLNDRMSVVETMEEIIIPEAGGVQTEQQSTPQETKLTAETPQEHVDSSTYKNLQHHEYTPFTFVDYDVELSKFRLPQPSSGRISPRH